MNGFLVFCNMCLFFAKLQKPSRPNSIYTGRGPTRLKIRNCSSWPPRSFWTVRPTSSPSSSPLTLSRYIAGLENDTFSRVADPDRIGSGFNRVRDSDPDPGGQKWPTKIEKKIEKFMFWSVGWPLLRAEGFFCNLNVLYGGLGIVNCSFWWKKNFNFFSAVIFFQFLVIKALDPYWYSA